MFEITAFNPALKPEQSTVDNISALQSLERDIEKHPLLSKLQRWESFGFEMSLDYHESGLAIGCEESARIETREALLNLGRKYGHGAIYEFSSTSLGTHIRSTVPTSPDFDSVCASV